MNVGVIGCGRLGAAIVRGLARAGVDPKRFYLLDRSEDRLKALLYSHPLLNVVANEEQLLRKA